MVEPKPAIKWIGNGVRKRIYYHPDGTPTNPLPADNYSLQHYLAKGFTLEPPRKAESEILRSQPDAPNNQPKDRPPGKSASDNRRVKVGRKKPTKRARGKNK